MVEIHFSIGKARYIIHKGGEYMEILEAASRRRVENQKQVCRDYGIEVSTDANVMNTHTAIDLLVERLIRDMYRQ